MACALSGGPCTSRALGVTGKGSSRTRVPGLAWLARKASRKISQDQEACPQPSLPLMISYEENTQKGKEV